MLNAKKSPSGNPSEFAGYAVPPAPYIGGKRILARTVVEHIQSRPHTTYAEPFIGMGGVFFRRPVKARAEVINDLSGDVVTLFRVLQRHYQAFLHELKFSLSSRSEFERYLKMDPATLTDIERAMRFLFIQRLTFGGKVASRVFGVSVDRPARFDLPKVLKILEDVHERLSGVTIENLDYLDFIRRYDRKNTLFYLDPPYWGSENDYGKGVFDKSFFPEMADALRNLKGSFVLSINDTPQIREIFGGFNLHPVSLNYSISREGSTEAKELIIRNF